MSAQASANPLPDSAWVTLLRPYSTGQRVEPPLGIACVAAYLDQTSFRGRVNIVDCEAERLRSAAQVLTALRKSQTAVLGISFFTYDRFAALAVARIAKRAGIVTVAGGLHVSSLPVETMEACPEFDYGVVGEGEVTFHELLAALAEGKTVEGIPGVVWRSARGVVLNPPRDLIPDLDALPPPAYHLLPMHLYRNHAVIGSRGCPNACKFCASPGFWRRKLRFRSPVSVLDEIELLLREHGRKPVRFKDDTFTCNPKWALAVCEGIIQRQFHIEWDLLARARGLQRESLVAARNAGAYKIRLGVESGDDAIREIIGKNVSRDEVFAAVRMARETGFRVVGCFFMVGLPGETDREMQESYRLAVELNPEYVSFKPADIYPGTEFCAMAAENGLIPSPFPWFAPDTLRRYPPGFQVYAGIPTYTQHFSRTEIQERAAKLLLDLYAWKLFEEGDSPTPAFFEEMGLAGVRGRGPLPFLRMLLRGYLRAPRGRRWRGLCFLPGHAWRMLRRVASH